MPTEEALADPGLISAARRNFRFLSRQDQFSLAALVARSREAECKLAYKAVVRLAHGYKTTGGDTRGLGGRIVRTPCVVFVVSRKWQAPRSNDPQQIPRHLLTPWPVDGKLSLCAVPTDVRPLAYYGQPEAMASFGAGPFGILVRRVGRPDEAGAVACLVRRPADPANLFAVSCRHVFSRSLRDPGFVSPPLEVCSPSGAKLAVTTRHMGELRAAPNYSLDSQLALATDLEGFGTAFKGISSLAQGAIGLENEPLSTLAYIATPRVRASGVRHLVPVKPVEVMTGVVMKYRLGSGAILQVRHRTLIAAETSERVEHGDSGSPVLATANGGRLLGMFVAGSRKARKAYYIPAWDLLDPGRYGLNEPPWLLV